MSALFQESGSTAADRRKEADQIIVILSDYLEQMEPRESSFIERISEDVPISPKMIFWLRDIKDKYL